MITATILGFLLILIPGWIYLKKLSIGKGTVYNLIMASLVAAVMGFAIMDAFFFTQGMFLPDDEHEEELIDEYETSEDEEYNIQDSYEDEYLEEGEEEPLFPKGFAILILNIVLIVWRIISTFISLVKKSRIFKDISGDQAALGLLSRQKFLSLGSGGWPEHIEAVNGPGLRSFYMGLRNLSQQSIYLVCVSTLIYAVANDNLEGNIFATILNFGLFFILDDWQIMHEYSAEAGGNLLRKHRLKNWGVNALLGISCVAFLLGDIISGLDLFDTVVNLCLMILLVLFMLWRRNSDFNTYERALFRKKK